MERQCWASYIPLVKDKQLALKISKTVRELRLDAGLTQEALAEACDRHPTLISQIERAKNTITVETAHMIASAFGLSLEQFFHLVEQQEGPVPKKRAKTFCLSFDSDSL